MSLSNDEKHLLGNTFKESNLDFSMDRASHRDPDSYANTLTLSKEQNIPLETVERNKPEIDRRKRLSDINVPDLKFSYPKTAKWLEKEENASIALDDLDVLKGMEKTLKESERGFLNNAGRGGLKTINSLTGNLLEFIGNNADNFEDFMVNTVGAPNPGIVMGDDGLSWSWDIPPEQTDAGLIGKAISEGNVYDYQPRFTWEKLKGDVTAQNLAGYVVEQGVQSLPHMLATLYTLPAYIASRTEDIAETRVTNDDRDEVTTGDLITSLVPATAVALMERLGAKVTFGTAKAIGAKGVAKAAGAAAVIEGGTEFVQEGIEYLGETVGTKKKVSGAEMLDRQFAGLVAGSGMGASIRGGSATIEAIGNRTEKQVMDTVKSMSDQETIDNVVMYAQSSTTNQRSSQHFEDYVNALGPDREVLIPAEIAAQLENAPEYITVQLDALGTSVSVPLSKFATDIATNPEMMNIVRPHITLSENGLSQVELDEGDNKQLKSLLDKAQKSKDTLTEADKVFDIVKDQLVATGMQSETTAKYAAQLYPAAATVWVDKARKMGHDVTVADIFDMMGFSVESDIMERKEAVVDKDEVIVDQLAQTDVTVDVERIETGEITQETRNAREVMDEIEGAMDSYKNLRDCLA